MAKGKNLEGLTVIDPLAWAQEQPNGVSEFTIKPGTRLVLEKQGSRIRMNQISLDGHVETYAVSRFTPIGAAAT